LRESHQGSLFLYKEGEKNMTKECTERVDRRELSPVYGLREIEPGDITSYLEREWDRQVKVTLAPFGKILTVPEGWHGAGKQGDALVEFGDVLTKPIAGTALPPDVFTDWLSKKGFSFENGEPIQTPQKAAYVLGSDQTHSDGIPVFRAVRTSDKGVPMIIELYHGAQADEVKRLSAIGNMNGAERSERDKETYRTIVHDLMMPFISVGTTKAKERMGLDLNVPKVRRIDDCAAALSTIAADIAIDRKKGIKQPGLEEIGVSIATTQAMVIAVHLAEKRNVPLLLRVGAPAFGLDTSNYMHNVYEEMLTLGGYVSGDFGDIMSTGNEQYQQPHIRIYGNGSPRNVTRFYYNGGGPIETIMAMQYKNRGKPYHGIIEVYRASRIDNGPGYWGVILAGKQLNRV